MGREWHADEVADRLVREGRIPPLIIVGIWNTPDRVADYTPDQDPEEQRGDHKPQGRGGNGTAYLRWITEELKPMIDREYRTDPARGSTGIMGSSLGGIISLAAAEERPGTFGRVAAVSPSLWWNSGSVIDRWTTRRPCPQRLWLCMGDRERKGLDAELRRLEAAIRGVQDMTTLRLHAEIVPGGTHDEPSWSARLDRVLVFLFGDPLATAPEPATLPHGTTTPRRATTRAARCVRLLMAAGRSSSTHRRRRPPTSPATPRSAKAPGAGTWVTNTLSMRTEPDAA